MNILTRVTRDATFTQETRRLERCGGDLCLKARSQVTGRIVAQRKPFIHQKMNELSRQGATSPSQRHKECFSLSPPKCRVTLAKREMQKLSSESHLQQGKRASFQWSNTDGNETFVRRLFLLDMIVTEKKEQARVKMKVAFVWN